MLRNRDYIAYNHAIEETIIGKIDNLGYTDQFITE